MRLRRAVFFDRDGTLMRDVHYCGDPAKVEVYPGVSGALRKLRMAGFATVIVSNQSGIGRGWITEAQYRAVEREFLHQAGGVRALAGSRCAQENYVVARHSS